MGNFDVSEITYFCVILCFRTTGTFFKKNIFLLFLTCQITLFFFHPGGGEHMRKNHKYAYILLMVDLRHTVIIDDYYDIIYGLPFGVVNFDL